MEKCSYATAIGCLINAQTCTRPDINFAVIMISTYQSNAGMAIWVGVKESFVLF